VRRCGGEAGPNGAMRHIFRVARAGETFINNCMGIKCYQRGFWVGSEVQRSEEEEALGGRRGKGKAVPSKNTWVGAADTVV
jgi:hypothetical protein